MTDAGIRRQIKRVTNRVISARHIAGSLKRRLGGNFLALGLRLGAIQRPEHGMFPDPFSAGLANWITRRDDRQGSTIAPRWRDEANIALPAPAVVVVVHVSDASGMVSILEHLSYLPVDFDLIVTNATGEPIVLPVSGSWRSSSVLDLPDQGRDMFALAALVSADLLEPYELVVKIHADGGRDTDGLEQDSSPSLDSALDALLGSRAIIENILRAFAVDQKLGVVTMPATIGGSDAWGENINRVGSLLSRLQIPLDETGLSFAVGPVQVMRAFILQGLKSFDLSEWDFEVESGLQHATSVSAMRRLLGIVAIEAGYELRDSLKQSTFAASDDSWRRFDGTSAGVPRARVFSFYGRRASTPGASARADSQEQSPAWLNVAQAKTVYAGHEQPFLPGELGFYGPGTPGIRTKQAELSSAAGLAGFGYRIYWSVGDSTWRHSLEEHQRTESAQEFFIVWAHDAADAGGGVVPSEGRPDFADTQQGAVQFFSDVAGFLAHPSYLLLGGMPVLVIERANRVENLSAVVKDWRKQALDLGLAGLKVVLIDDASPSAKLWAQDGRIDAVIKDVAPMRSLGAAAVKHVQFDRRFVGRARPYGSVATASERDLRSLPNSAAYPSLIVDFDASPSARWHPDLLVGANPYTFRRWLSSAVASVAGREPDDRLVLVNSWNDWPTRAVLEPSQRHGKAYLLAVRDVLFP